MAVIKIQSDGIRALGFDLVDAHMFLAMLEYLLARAMAPDFCRRRKYP
jgi:hypothetical protein